MKDSKSAEGNLVGVRPPLPAPIKSILWQINASLDAFFCAHTVPKPPNALLNQCQQRSVQLLDPQKSLESESDLNSGTAFTLA
jgi:hypothetical protein